MEESEYAFYITLPCNGSMDFYPKNSIGCFTNKLSKGLTLRGDWEVGLVELAYPRTIESFTARDADFLLCMDGRCNHLTLPHGFYNNIREIIAVLNTKTEEYGVSFGYDRVANRVSVISEKLVGLGFYGKLARILGFPESPRHDDLTYLQKSKDNCTHRDTVLIEALVKTPARFMADICGGDWSLFVYSDVISHQIVGDSYVQLLRQVQIEGANGSLITQRFDRVHYARVAKRAINEISIDIKNDQNITVPFSYGKSYVKLHFRPIKDHFKF